MKRLVNLSGVILFMMCMFLDAMTEKEKIKISKEAQDSYAQLIKPSKYFGKDMQAKNLEMLGALLMQKAITRIQTIIEGYLGKNDAQYKNMASIAKNLGKSLEVFFPAQSRSLPQSVNKAFLWATGAYIIEQQKPTYYKSIKATDKEMSDYKKKYGKNLPAVRLVALLDQELNELNNMYAPILETIKSLGRKTILPPVTELKILYKDALGKSW